MQSIHQPEQNPLKWKIVNKWQSEEKKFLHYCNNFNNNISQIYEFYFFLLFFSEKVFSSMRNEFKKDIYPISYMILDKSSKRHHFKKKEDFHCVMFCCEEGAGKFWSESFDGRALRKLWLKPMGSLKIAT